MKKVLVLCTVALVLSLNSNATSVLSDGSFNAGTSDSFWSSIGNSIKTGFNNTIRTLGGSWWYF